MERISAHAETWIDAYLDGELSPLRTRQAQAHLAQCPECQGMLAQRRSLSVLLESAPPAGELKPSAQFVADVRLQLKPRAIALPATPRPGQPFALRWRAYIIPIALLLGLVFIQTVFLLSRLVGIFPGLEQFLMGDLPQTLTGLSLPQLLGAFYQALGVLNPMNWNWITGLLALAATGLMYLSWLTSWWTRQTSSNASSG